MTEPRFSTAWEREDYEREKRGEKPLGPSMAGEATPTADLERQIMDSNIPKNEREWWAAREIERLRRALTDIRDHWACQYDHPRKESPMYSGSYGIGVTDGHRAAAIIARKALGENHD